MLIFHKALEYTRINAYVAYTTQCANEFYTRKGEICTAKFAEYLIRVRHTAYSNSAMWYII